MTRALLVQATQETAFLGDVRTAQVSSGHLRWAKVWAKVSSWRRVSVLSARLCTILSSGDRTLAQPCELCLDMVGNERSNRYHSIFMTGRTSTDPVRAFGTRAAQLMAVSNDSTSIRK